MPKLKAEWLESLFTSEPQAAWDSMFLEVTRLTKPDSKNVPIKTYYTTLENELSQLDAVLSSSAWNLWQHFSLAKRGSQAVIDFWQQTIGPKAVLILDSLSVREVGPLATTLKNIGASVISYSVAGSEIPSETDPYSSALGLSGRASMRNKSLPKSFKIETNETKVELFSGIPFAEATHKLPNAKNLFVWFGWPDDTLHEISNVEDSLNRFIEHVNETFASDGFSELLSKLLLGRELLITSDHGYCHSSEFITTDGPQHEALRQLGHKRAKKISQEEVIADKNVPPVTLYLKSTTSNDTHRIAVGRLRPSDRGFPSLTHGGLSLMECCVPVLHVRSGGKNG